MFKKIVFILSLTCVALQPSNQVFASNDLSINGENCENFDVIVKHVKIIRNGEVYLNLYQVPNLNKIPPAIGVLTNLNWVRAVELKLTKVPASISFLINLRELNLNGNRLMQLPQEIFTLPKLAALNLGRNLFVTLPGELGQLTNLRELYLHNNSLKEIPSTIGNLSNLETLTLHSNFLIELPTTLGKIKNLKYLYIGKNPFSQNQKLLLTLQYCLFKTTEINLDVIAPYQIPAGHSIFGLKD